MLTVLTEGTADVIKYLMDQHGLITRVTSCGQERPRHGVVPRLRARFRVPADILLVALRDGRTHQPSKRLPPDTSTEVA